MDITITQGAFAGRTGTAAPYRAYGPADARQFTALVTLDDGSGIIELPVDAIEGRDVAVQTATRILEALDQDIAAHYHDHPYLGWTVQPGMGGKALRRLRELREQARRDLNAAQHEAGIPLTIRGAMWMINQADSGCF